MSLIVAPNGHQFTSAAQEMRVKKLKVEFHKILGKEMAAALRAAQPGRTLEVNIHPLLEVIDQAYFLGREDG